MNNAPEFTSHLKSTGKFSQFKARRKEIEANGTPKHIAWKAAAVEFGWSPHWTPGEQPESAEDDATDYGIPMTQSQYAAVKAAADTRGVTVQEFMRTSLMRATENPVPDQLALYELDAAQEGVDFQQAVTWAAEHANRQTPPEQSPNGIALSLLLFARDDPVGFLKFAGKYLDKSQEVEAKKALEDDKRKQFALIDTFCNKELERLEKEGATG